jgi:dTDP-4-dehydrorhamnose reductase
LKICIIGGNGVIGLELVKQFVENGDDVFFTYFKNKINHKCKNSKLDITDKDATINLITKLMPDVVIHAAALTNVDLCEIKHDLANSINVDGVKNVLEGCDIVGSKIVYISSSFVFDGKKCEYYENDQTSPATYYGITKFNAEKCVMESNSQYLILRTDQPYCWNKNWQHTNSVVRVIKTLKSGKELNEIRDWCNTPTFVPDFVKATLELISRNLTGIYHVVGSDYIDRFNWSLLVANIFDLNKKLIKPINSNELSLSAKRVNVNLKNKKLFEHTGVQMKGINEGLYSMLNEKPKNI